MPYSKSNKQIQDSAFKMKGMDFGNSPLADKGEVVSKTSPGPGWTKTKGTNIWAPPKGKMMAKMTRMLKPLPKKGVRKGMSISDFDDTI